MGVTVCHIPHHVRFSLIEPVAKIKKIYRTLRSDCLSDTMYIHLFKHVWVAGWEEMIKLSNCCSTSEDIWYEIEMMGVYYTLTVTAWQAGQKRRKESRRKNSDLGLGALKGDRHHIWREHCALCGWVCVCVCVCVSMGELSVYESRQPVISWHQFPPTHWRLCQRSLCVI